MKVIIKPASRLFANKLALLSSNYNCPVVKNRGDKLILYMVSEIKCNLMLNKIYALTDSSLGHYDFIKVKRFTPILDIKYKGKCGN